MEEREREGVELYEEESESGGKRWRKWKREREREWF